MPIRDLLVVLGDQLDRSSPLFTGADPCEDRIWMAEVREESTHVPSHQARIAVFLSAMRHFRDEFRAHGWPVEYREIDAIPATLAGNLGDAIRRLNPRRVRVVEPGDYRVAQALRAVCPEIDIVTDTHFLCSGDQFRQHARGRKQLRMEFFYREMRRRHSVLMEGDRPVGGAWNYDAENRGSFPKPRPGPHTRSRCLPTGPSDAPRPEAGAATVRFASRRNKSLRLARHAGSRGTCLA